MRKNQMPITVHLFPYLAVVSSNDNDYNGISVPDVATMNTIMQAESPGVYIVGYYEPEWMDGDSTIYGSERPIRAYFLAETGGPMKAMMAHRDKMQEVVGHSDFRYAVTHCDHWTSKGDTDDDEAEVHTNVFNAIAKAAHVS